MATSPPDISTAGPSTTGMNPPTMLPGDQQPAAPQSIASKVIDAIGGVLGGKTNTRYFVDESGKTHAMQETKSRGQQFASIAANALRGEAAAAGVHGPGAGIRSLGVGAEGVMQHNHEQDKLKRQQASTDFEQEQQATARKGQIALQNQQIAESSWRMVREQGEIDTKTADRLNEMNGLVASDKRNKDYGHYPSFQDFLEKHKELGADIPKLQAQGLVRAIPEFSGGKPTGVHIYEIHPAWADQKNDDPVKVSVPSGLDDKGKPQYKDYTIPAGGMTNGDVLRAQIGLGQQAMKASSEAAAVEAETQVTPKEKFIQAQETARAEIGKQTASGIKGMDTIEDLSSKGQNNYLHFAAEHNNFVNNLTDAATGNQVASALAGLMGIQNVNSIADMKRINPQETKAIGPELGSIVRRLETFSDKAGTGKLPTQTINEWRQLAQRGLDAKYDAYLTAVHQIQLDHKLDPAQTQIAAKDGSLTTLDKALQKSQLTNLHVNPQTGAKIGWNGSAWVTAP